MSGGSLQPIDMTSEAQTICLPYSLRPSRSLLWTGVGGLLLIPALVLFVWMDEASTHRDDPGRHGMVIVFMCVFASAWVASLHMTIRWFTETFVVSERGFVRRGMFRFQEIHWATVRKAVWGFSNHGTYVRLYLEDRSIPVWFSNWCQLERRWLMDLVHERIAVERQEGWDRIEKARERGKQALAPVKHGDVKLCVAAAACFGFGAWVWLAALRLVPRSFVELALSLGVLASPSVVLLCLLDLVRHRVTAWLAAALALAVLACLFLVASILRLIGG